MLGKASRFIVVSWIGSRIAVAAACLLFICPATAHDESAEYSRAIPAEAIRPHADEATVRALRQIPRAPVQDGEPKLFAQTDFDELRLGDEAVDSDETSPTTFLAPPLAVDFTGLNDGGSIPPDTVGSVGPNHVTSMTNNSWRVYDKVGTPVTAEAGIQSFWSALGIAAGQPASAPYDPRIVFDQYADRWVASVLGNAFQADGTNNAWLLVAISQTNNPSLGWNLFAIRTNIAGTHPTHFADFDIVGLDPNNIIVTANIFTQASAFVHADVWVINKASMIAAAGPLISGVDYALFHNPCSTGNLTFTTCHTFGQTAVTAENYLVDSGWLDNATRMRRLFRVKRITGTGAAAALACAGGNDFLEVAQYNFNQLDATQPSCGTAIETNDSFFKSAAAWRNGKIWVTHSVGSGAGITDAAPPSKTEAAWYEINPAVAGAFPGGVPNQQGRIAHATQFYYFPSIAVNASECVALGFSGSDAATFASAFYTLRNATDAPGTMQPIGVLRAGLGHYRKNFGGSRNRWGDYSATVVDPTDDFAFWTVQEYARVPLGSPAACAADSGRWGTWWGKFECSACAAPPSPAVGDDLCDGGANNNLPCSRTSDCPGGTCGVKNRFLSTTPGNPGVQTALRVTLTNLPQFPAFNGQTRWVGSPQTCFECNGVTPMKVAPLQASQHCRDWGAEGLTHLFGSEVVPGSQYSIQAIDCACSPGDPGSFSPPLMVDTSKWGNVAATFGGAQPNFLDISEIVDVFQCDAGSMNKVRAILQPQIVNACVPLNFLQVSSAVSAFQGNPYPFVP